MPVLAAIALSCTAGTRAAELEHPDCFNEGEPELHGAALAERLRQADAELMAVLEPLKARLNDVEPTPAPRTTKAAAK